MTTPQYEASVIQVGNSRGMRLPAGFFQAHPEFKGKVSLTPVQPTPTCLEPLAKVLFFG